LGLGRARGRERGGGTWAGIGPTGGKRGIPFSFSFPISKSILLSVSNLGIKIGMLHFVGSPIHPPLGALNYAELLQHTCRLDNSSTPIDELGVDLKF
jgi:hypothetical protein